MRIDRERTIPVLPSENAMLGKRPSHPERRVRLDETKRVGDR
jgi:hypothetical protein